MRRPLKTLLEEWREFRSSLSAGDDADGAFAQFLGHLTKKYEGNYDFLLALLALAELLLPLILEWLENLNRPQRSE